MKNTVSPRHSATNGQAVTLPNSNTASQPNYSNIAQLCKDYCSCSYGIYRNAATMLEGIYYEMDKQARNASFNSRVHVVDKLTANIGKGINPAPSRKPEEYKASSGKAATMRDNVTFEGSVKHVDKAVKAIMKEEECTLTQAIEQVFSNNTATTKQERRDANQQKADRAIEAHDVNAYIEAKGTLIVLKSFELLNRYSRILIDNKERADLMQDGMFYLFDTLANFEPYEYKVKETQTITLDNGKEAVKRTATGQVIVFANWYECPPAILYFALSYRVFAKLRNQIMQETRHSNKQISIEAIACGEARTPAELVTEITARANRRIDQLGNLEMLKGTVLNAADYRVVEMLLSDKLKAADCSRQYKRIKASIRASRYDYNEVKDMLTAIKGQYKSTAYGEDRAAAYAEKVDKQTLANIIYKLA